MPTLKQMMKNAFANPSNIDAKRLVGDAVIALHQQQDRRIDELGAENERLQKSLNRREEEDEVAGVRPSATTTMTGRGRVPKEEYDDDEAVKAVRGIISYLADKYFGNSFNPLAIAAFKKELDDILEDVKEADENEAYRSYGQKTDDDGRLLLSNRFASFNPEERGIIKEALRSFVKSMEKTNHAN